MWMVYEVNTIRTFHCEDKEINTEALSCVYLDTSFSNGAN